MLFILPAPIFFGLTVRGLGFVPSIFLTTLIAALASLKMKLARSAAARACRHGLFHAGLQLRAWACRSGVSAPGCRSEERGHGSPLQSRAWLRDRRLARESVLLPDRRDPRHADRRAAGHRRHGDHRHAAADHLPARAGLVAHHAGRHLLRRAVWRLDHGHPDQHAGRILIRRDGHRRLPDGPQGQGRNRAGGGGPRLVLRRHAWRRFWWRSSRRR